jgi:hypothetical protein
VRLLAPMLFDDEILSSFWTRFCARAGLPITALTTMLLGRKWTPGFFQAGHIAQTAAIVGITAEELLHWHTVFPYATAFTEPSVHAAALANALSVGVNARGSGAVTQSVSEQVNGRRFCKQCAGAEFERTGESYWHRSHNLPAVLVCLKHRALLTELPWLPTNGARSWSYSMPHEVMTLTAAERGTRRGLANARVYDVMVRGQQGVATEEAAAKECGGAEVGSSSERDATTGAAAKDAAVGTWPFSASGCSQPNDELAESEAATELQVGATSSKGRRFLNTLAMRSIEVLQSEYGAFAERSQGWPAWYREQLVARGLLTPGWQTGGRLLAAFVQRQVAGGLPDILLRDEESCGDGDANGAEDAGSAAAKRRGARENFAFSWLRLMIRPGQKIPFIPLKHLIFQTALELCPSDGGGESLDHSPVGYQGKTRGPIDARCSQELRRIVDDAVERGAKVSVLDALREVGVWQLYRHGGADFPLVTAEVKRLRTSEASLRRTSMRRIAMTAKRYQEVRSQA